MAIDTIAAKKKKQELQSIDGNNVVAVNANANANLYQCSACKAMLGRHRFSKKIFRRVVIDRQHHHHHHHQQQQQQQPRGAKASDDEKLVCQQCKRLETAKRCKQTPPKPLKHDSTRAESGARRRPNNFGYCDYVDKLFGMDCFATDIAPLRVFRSAKDVSESMAAVQAVFRHGTVRNKASRDDGKVLCLCIGDGCTPRTALLMAFLAKERESWECVSIDPALSEEWSETNKTSGGATTNTSAPTGGIRGLYGYKGTLIEFLTDPNRPPGRTPGGEAQQPPPRSRRQTWRHLVLVCVHSHARFVKEASIERIRYLYSHPLSPSSSERPETPGSARHGIESSPEENSKTTLIIPSTTIVSLPCCPTFRHVRDIGRPPSIKYDDDCVFSACRSVEVWNFEEEEKEDDNDDNEHPGITEYCSENITLVHRGNMAAAGFRRPR